MVNRLLLVVSVEYMKMIFHQLKDLCDYCNLGMMSDPSNATDVQITHGCGGQYV